MKAQADDEKQRREKERNKLVHEQQLRAAAERDKKNLEEKLINLQNQMRAASERLRRTEETAEMFQEKSRVQEEEVLLTQHKAHTFQVEMERLRENVRDTEKEKEELERKMRHAEIFVTSLAEEREKKTYEADELKRELLSARVAESEAKQKLFDFISRSMSQTLSVDNRASNRSSPFNSTNTLGNSTASLVESDINSYDLFDDGIDTEMISRELERERLVVIYDFVEM